MSERSNGVKDSPLWLNEALRKSIKDHSLLIVSIVESKLDDFRETYLFKSNELSESDVAILYGEFQKNFEVPETKGSTEFPSFELWVKQKGFQCEKLLETTINPLNPAMCTYTVAS